MMGLYRRKKLISRRLKTLFLSCLFPIILTGCSVLKPVELPQVHTYTLDPSSVAITKKPKTNLSLLVQQPVMNSGFDTQRMAYMTRNFDIGYFSENQWAGNPGQLLAPLVAQTLSLSGHYQSVVMPPYAGFVDRELDLKILSFYQDFRTDPSQIHLRVIAQLIDRRTGRVIKTRDFIANQATTIDTPYGGVIAANKAVAKFLTQLSQFA